MSVGPGRSAKSRACAASSAGGVAINTWPTRAAPSPSFKPHRRFGSSRWCWSSGSTVQTVVPSAASQLGPARRADSSRSLRPGRTAAMRRAVRMSCRRVLLRAAISSWRRQGRVYQLPKILCGSGQLNCAYATPKQVRTVANLRLFLCSAKADQGADGEVQRIGSLSQMRSSFLPKRCRLFTD